jgi:hypothetical protein
MSEIGYLSECVDGEHVARCEPFWNASHTFFPRYDPTTPNLGIYKVPTSTDPNELGHDDMFVCPRCTQAAEQFMPYLTTIEHQAEEIKKLRTSASTNTNQPAPSAD